MSFFLPVVLAPGHYVSGHFGTAYLPVGHLLQNLFSASNFDAD